MVILSWWMVDFCANVSWQFRELSDKLTKIFSNIKSHFECKFYRSRFGSSNHYSFRFVSLLLTIHRRIVWHLLRSAASDCADKINQSREGQRDQNFAVFPAMRNRFDTESPLASSWFRWIKEISDCITGKHDVLRNSRGFCCGLSDIMSSVNQFYFWTVFAWNIRRGFIE